MELKINIDADLKDVDKKLGKKTVSTMARIGGRWGGAALLAKAGATIGLSTGPASPIVSPVLALVGEVTGAFAGDALAEWVVDITYMGD